MEKWFVQNKKADFAGIADTLHCSQVLARILRNRDLLETEDMEVFLHGGLENLHSPWLLHGMESAVTRIMLAIQNQEPIRVMGDYDVDGICSTYILKTGFETLGAVVDCVIPHRIHDGYGLNENMIREASQANVKLIVTCDNGISAGGPIELAGQLGMEVIVTDHHEVPYCIEGGQKKELLPKAYAIVDPKQEADEYPFPGICGAVVAYKLISALFETCKQKDADYYEIHQLEMILDALLEPAALATVCDVMELVGENRLLVKEGIKRMRNPSNLGLTCLMEVNGIQPDKLKAFHFGFILGPCLNATGRLDSADKALELLCQTDKKEAMELAIWLKELNDSRKNKTLEGEKQAIAYLTEHKLEQDKVLVIYLEEVHESLAGIIAGRIRERYSKPTFVLTRAEEGAKGSGRSIETYHMYESLVEVGHLLTKFGGHKLAAGLSLPISNIDAFRDALNRNCTLGEADFYEKVSIDAVMPMAYGSLELARELEALEPFGVGNPKPLFAEKDACIVGAKRMGKQGNMLKLRVKTGFGGYEELVYFGNGDAFLECFRSKYGESAVQELFAGEAHYPMSVAYSIGVNSYMGKESKQNEMKYYL